MYTYIYVKIEIDTHTDKNELHVSTQTQIQTQAQTLTPRVFILAVCSILELNFSHYHPCFIPPALSTFHAYSPHLPPSRPHRALPLEARYSSARNSACTRHFASSHTTLPNQHRSGF